MTFTAQKISRRLLKRMFRGLPKTARALLICFADPRKRAIAPTIVLPSTTVIFRRSDGSLLEKRMCCSRLKMIFGILIKKSALPSLYVYRDVEIKRKYIQTYTERFTEKSR